MQSFLTTAAIFALLRVASARPFFPRLIPNGEAANSPGSGITCLYLGHRHCQPPVNNQFGLDFKKAGFRWTKAFCMQDSDGDGLTNGEELGDPCCEWTTANQKLSRETNLSHPGDASQKATGAVSCVKTAPSGTATPSTSKVRSSPVTLPVTSPAVAQVTPSKVAAQSVAFVPVVSIGPAISPALPPALAPSSTASATLTPTVSNSVADASKVPQVAPTVAVSPSATTSVSATSTPAPSRSSTQASAAFAISTALPLMSPIASANKSAIFSPVASSSSSPAVRRPVVVTISPALSTTATVPSASTSAASEPANSISSTTAAAVVIPSSLNVPSTGNASSTPTASSVAVTSSPASSTFSSSQSPISSASSSSALSPIPSTFTNSTPVVSTSGVFANTSIPPTLTPVPSLDTVTAVAALTPSFSATSVPRMTLSGPSPSTAPVSKPIVSTSDVPVTGPITPVSARVTSSPAILASVTPSTSSVLEISPNVTTPGKAISRPTASKSGLPVVLLASPNITATASATGISERNVSESTTLEPSIPASTPSVADIYEPPAPPSNSPSIAPVSPNRTTNSSAACFPANATVRLEGGSVVQMANLAIGDSVEVASGTYSQVFMFTHRTDSVFSEFVSIRTRSGAHLQLSPGHFLYLNGHLAPAEDARVGHVVEADSAPCEITAVSRVVKEGLYNPQTLHGDVVVDRIRVSTYTKAFDFGGGQAALTPFRALYVWFGVIFQVFESGVRDALPLRRIS